MNNTIFNVFSIAEHGNNEQFWYLAPPKIPNRIRQ